MAVNPKATATFPDQQTIVQFYDSHPVTPTLQGEYVAHACGPDSVQKVSSYFAGKKMHCYEIKSHIVAVLAPNGEQLFSQMEANAQTSLGENEDNEVVATLQATLKGFQPTFFNQGVNSHEAILVNLWFKEAQKLTSAQ